LNIVKGPFFVRRQSGLLPRDGSEKSADVVNYRDRMLKD